MPNDERSRLIELLRNTPLGTWSDDELYALARMVRAIERRQGILPALDRRRDRARRSAIGAGLRELRDANSWSRPQPDLRVIDGGDES